MTWSAQRQENRSSRGWHGRVVNDHLDAAELGEHGDAATHDQRRTDPSLAQPTILTSNGFSKSSALHVSVGLGVTYLVMMCIGLSIVDRVGRRRLTMTMIPGAALALLVLGTLFVTGNSGRSDVPFIVACLTGLPQLVGTCAASGGCSCR